MVWNTSYMGAGVLSSDGIKWYIWRDEGMKGLNSFKLYRLLEHSLVIRRLLGTPGSVPKHHGCRFSHS